MASQERPSPQALIEKTLHALPYQPNSQQYRLLMALADYAGVRGPADVFILSGYAGTGKSSLMGAFVKALRELKVPTVVLAPTGRAAKVASGFAGGKASTIHRRIFRPVASPDGSQTYCLVPNRTPGVIFIVDEASLVTDNGDNSASILCQLLRHIHAAPDCGLILMGDTAQLPPVGQSDSPAMNPERIRRLGLNPISFSLTDVARQAAESGILYNATVVRRLVEWSASNPLAPKFPFPKLKVSGFADIRKIDGGELADELASSWSSVGAEETLLVTRSNWRANEFNKAVRGRVLMAEDPLQQGDRLVIAKNDYYWSRINKLEGFIANGDVAVVTWVGRTEKMYGRYFVDVELEFPADGTSLGAKIMLRSLMAEGPALPRAEMERFYTHALAEQEGEISEKIMALEKDPYYNALQAKYAYCVTCHKAQGGQWAHVYVDLGGITEESLGQDFYRWLYTAMTRATQRLYLVNPPFPVG